MSTTGWSTRIFCDAADAENILVNCDAGETLPADPSDDDGDAHAPPTGATDWDRRTCESDVDLFASRDHI
jgi:hypothetical protein